MTETQLQTLKQSLLATVNLLRNQMDADKYRDYILGLLFFKYLSENLAEKANQLLEGESVSFDQLDADHEDMAFIRETMTEDLGYFLQPDEHFGKYAERGSRGDFILEDLEKTLAKIERSGVGTVSEGALDNLFQSMVFTSADLGNDPDARNENVVAIVTHLNKIDFGLADANSDVLGDAYEFLIGDFAAGAGKRAGEFYSPQCAATILAKIVSTGKTRLRSVYDPTCGSGSLLLRTSKEVDQVGTFYGQEKKNVTYNLARMNMLLHGVSPQRFDIQCADTLEDPRHADESFEAIVANPPFSANWKAGQIFEKDDRFSPYGRLAPKGNADYAFISHILHHLDDNGTAAVIMPHGPLFRGAAEASIRKEILERNLLDAVIGLPANIFYGASIPTCIMVFKKCKSDEKVLFVDGSDLFEKAKSKNTMNDEHIEKIVAAYRDRQEVERFTHLAAPEEIRENDFNLNIPRYVDTFEPEPEVDLAAVTAELKEIEADMGEVDAKIRAFCEDLGLEAPV